MDVVSDRPVTRPPYEAYATIMGVFVGGIAVAGGLARLLGRDPREHTFLDLLTLSAASFKSARTISRDEVTSFLRDPFVEGEAHEGDERPKQTGGMEQAIGELVQPLHRDVDRGRTRVHTGARTALRAPPDLDACRRRSQRLPADRLRGPAEQGKRAGEPSL